MPRRKIPTCFRLQDLTQDKLDILASWMIDDGCTQQLAREQLLAKFGADISANAIREFWRNVCIPMRLSRAALAANVLGQQTNSLGASWDASSRALLRQHYFELLAAPRVNPAELAKFGSLVANLQRADLDQAKLRASRQQAAVTARLRRQALRQDLEKFRNRVRTDTDRALETFYHEIQGNAEALSAFANLRAAVEAATSPV